MTVGSAWKCRSLGLVGLLLASASACGGSSKQPGTSGSGAGGTSVGGTGGTSTGGTGGTGGSSGGSLGTGGVSGHAGAAGEGGWNGGGAGAAGTGGEPPFTWPACESNVEVPPDTCSYPESLGGGGIEDECGVTAGAWFPIGPSAAIQWPELAEWGSANGIGVSRSWMTLPKSVDVAFDGQGYPTVAFTSYRSGGEKLTVRRWDGDAWQQLDDLPLGGVAKALDLVVDGWGGTIVATTNAANVIRVARDVGMGWEQLGEWSDVGSDVRLAVDDAENPTVALIGDDISVRRWTGSNWETLQQTERLFAPNPTSPGLALMANGDPVVTAVSEQSVRLLRWDGSGWSPLGISNDSAGLSGTGVDADAGTAVAVTGDGEIIVAWSGQYTAWNGSDWSEPGTLPLGKPELVADEAGVVYLLADDNPDVSLRRYLEGSWEEIPAPLRRQAATDSRLAAAGSGQLGLVWYEVHSAEIMAYYLGFAEGSWQSLPEQTAMASGLGPSNAPMFASAEAGPLVLDLGECRVLVAQDGVWTALPLPQLPIPEAYGCTQSSIAINAQGELFMGYTDPGVDGEGFFAVVRWDGESWQQVGAKIGLILLDLITVSRPRFAFDSANRPVVAFEYGDACAYLVYVYQYDGAKWVQLGRALTDRDWGETAQLMVDSEDRPFVVWRETRQYARAWTGDSWLPLEEGLEHAQAGAQLVAGNGRTPYLVWPEDDTLRILAWSGTEWTPLAPTEQTLASLPELARWQLSTERSQVYVQRFTDCAWTDLSASARGGGVSNGTGDAEASSLNVSGGQVCVAWSEYATGDRQAFVRCHSTSGD